MTDNKNEELKKLNEAYEDGLFRLVMNDVAEIEGKTLIEENNQLRINSEDMPSEETIDRFTKLLDSHIQKNKKTKNNHKLRK